MTQSSNADAEIRDAACVVLVDRGGSEPLLLLGKRRPDQIFLPSKWVFPGGRIDAADREADAVIGLPPWLHSFAHAARRELAEETGIIWQGRMAPFARAITPPGRIRRYDTWFFIAEMHAAQTAPLAGDGELLDLGWFLAGDARKLDLPSITRLVLDDAIAALSIGAKIEAEMAAFYYSNANGFERALIDCGACAPPP